MNNCLSDEKLVQFLHGDMAAAENEMAEAHVETCLICAARLDKLSDTQAIAELQVARPYDLAMLGTSFLGYYGGLYPVYVRGEAYLAAHQGAQAAAEFQKVLNT